MEQKLLPQREKHVVDEVFSFLCKRKGDRFIEMSLVVPAFSVNKHFNVYADKGGEIIPLGEKFAMEYRYDNDSCSVSLLENEEVIYKKQRKNKSYHVCII